LPWMLHRDGCNMVALLCELLMLVLILICRVLQATVLLGAVCKSDGCSMCDCCICTPAELPKLLLQFCTCCPFGPQLLQR
jgi:hypothetical protein